VIVLHKLDIESGHVGIPLPIVRFDKEPSIVTKNLRL